jgi:hypothetical protein
LLGNLFFFPKSINNYFQIVDVFNEPGDILVELLAMFGLFIGRVPVIVNKLITG